MKTTFIIAEAGINHNGDLNIAKQMIDAAAYAKVSAVKFQTFIAENVVCKNAMKAPYQLNLTDKNESQYEMIRKCELGIEAHKQLISYCKDKGVAFLSSPFDLESIDLLCELGLDIFKIPSGEITNLPFLKKIGKLKKEIILSTGMSYLNEVRAALNLLECSGTPKESITILHCNTEYPTPYADVNLRAMVSIKRELDVKVGYSDHTPGIEIPIAAVAMGAQIIEKHFTLDKSMKGPDHKASICPKELVEMVKAVRNVEKAMGDGIKKPGVSELKNRAIVRKSIVAATCIRAGERFSENNLTTKRPGNGISPRKWDEIIGKVAGRDYSPDEQIEA